MKTKLVLAVCAALLASGAAMAAQTDDQSGGAVQTTKTVTTTTRHVDGTNATWYKEGGVVPVRYRGNTYVVQKWQAEHLDAPTEGSRWLRGDNGDYLLVNDNTGTIISIIHQH